MARAASTIILVVVCYLQLVQSFKLRSPVGARKRYPRYPVLVTAGTDDGRDNNGDKAEEFGQIIPFDFNPSDFVRDKPPVLPKKSNSDDKQRNAKDILEENVRAAQKSLKIAEKQKRQEENYKLFDDDNARPTGYDNNDDEEEEEEERRNREADVNWVPSVDSDPNTDSPVFKFLKDTYIGSPYDSRKKQQARYVIRNITAISVLIGLIFTGIWYAFPGKFVSVRGTQDFSQRYNYVNPDDLLNEAMYKSGSSTVYFDENTNPGTNGYADREELASPRVPYQKNLLPRAPPPTVDL